ncbi:CBS domain-containing protein [Hyphomonas sp. WL0036]|uniref:CBS domain-containing protein n=1 Tax=Hyphomonas sediminis TaxID=2866160 RepID=UPI001C7F71F3|nr:CBS domain-containing protein [Hyphomonas sediminis]MBY9066286.1 CBS domain-containing protein [Hyphomonas sediminis]
MSIQSLLSSGETALLSCKPDDLLTTAVHLLIGAASNAVAVTGPSGQLVGILTDHDIVRAINAGHGSLGKARAEDWMTRPVVTVTPDTSLSNALGMMGHHRIRHVIVTDENGKPLAVVGVRAILAKLQEIKEMEIHVLRDMAVARR